MNEQTTTRSPDLWRRTPGPVSMISPRNSWPITSPDREGHSWIACRAFGVDYHLDEWGRRVFAHTSPVYLACGGDWAMADPEGIRYIRTLVEGAREYVRHTAVRRSDQLTTHHHGEADHLAWLERPFAEALHALEERGRR